MFGSIAEDGSLAGHAHMPTLGGRPWGARGISRSFLGKFLNFFTPKKSMRGWTGCTAMHSYGPTAYVKFLRSAARARGLLYRKKFYSTVDLLYR